MNYALTRQTDVMDRKRVIVIAGPTATGKTALSVQLAKLLCGEVVSADSMQIYKHMDIGTAKPTEDEKQGITHHMLDIIPPWEDYSAARYVSDAALCIEDIHNCGKIPVLTGGTGLYIDSLLSGRGFSARGDKTMRRELEAEYDEAGGESMLRKLGEVDQQSAGKLHANDKKRIVRALEVYKTTGKTISQHDIETKALPPRYDTIKIALTFADREQLYKKIERRVDTMISAGLEEEVRGLLKMEVPAESTSMQAIGYKEMVDAIYGRCGFDEAVEKIKLESRRYAKRQLTWLRRDTEISWITWEERPDIKECVKAIMEMHCEEK